MNKDERTQEEEEEEENPLTVSDSALPRLLSFPSIYK